ncbi:MAG: hypothetical protein Tsb002_16290 [Wenzhouxiangellaceae bacterium]
MGDKRSLRGINEDQNLSIMPLAQAQSFFNKRRGAQGHGNLDSSAPILPLKGLGKILIQALIISSKQWRSNGFHGIEYSWLESAIQSNPKGMAQRQNASTALLIKIRGRHHQPGDGLFRSHRGE